METARTKGTPGSTITADAPRQAPVRAANLRAMFSWRLIEESEGAQPQVLRAWQARLQARTDWHASRYEQNPTVRQGVAIAAQRRLLAEIGEVAEAGEARCPSLANRLSSLRIGLAAAGLLDDHT